MGKKTFVLHDDSVNTYGFRLLTAGGNLEEFKRNPVMFYRHNDYELPIGRWENIKVEDGRILADAVFDTEDEDAMRIKGKVDRDFIRMASIGTWAPEEISDDPALKLPGQTGSTITKWTMREASIVAIGANHNALRMYDRETGKQIDLADSATILRMFDQSLKNTDMNKLRSILNLADNASDADVEAAVEAVKQERDAAQQENNSLKEENTTLKEENKQLRDQAAQAEQERKNQQKTEATALVDAAVRDGRIDASGKEAFIALFDADFEKAKATLEAIPHRKSVTSRIEDPSVQMYDFASKSWDELDRAGMLLKLRDTDSDLYAEKFKQKFGHEPR
ncbi:MAG: hypothetical protein IKY80_05220 [Alistipes sp.]|nr:hypothetical protein [Alistipes sp.]